jgi:acyl-CoA synthetase (AMP-forming)/AMP-acid ligase II
VNQFVGMTYAQALAHIADRYADNEALIYRDRRWRFRDVKRLIDRASGRLATLGLPVGSSISIWLPNRPEYLWYLLGASQMGLVPVILNTRLREEEFAYQLLQSDSRAVIVPGDGAFRDFLADLTGLCPELRRQRPGELSTKALPQLRAVIALDDYDRAGLPGVSDWSDGLEGTAQEWPLPPMATDPDKPALISYSSGTTALPKGAMITHCVWRKAWDIGTPVDLTAKDKFYLAIPMFGSMASMNGVYPFWIRGAAVMLADRFDAEQAMADWQRERITTTHLLPPMITALIEHPRRKEYDLSSMRIGLVLSNDPDMLRKVPEQLGIPGMLTGYGLTETTTVLTRNRWDDPLELRIATQGKPLPDIEIKVVDPQTGAALPAVESGEIWARSYCVMKGYYNKPVETQKAIDAEGWFHTGDQGYLTEDGRVVFEGRIGDGYKTKGFNVSPAEIEVLLRKHPSVANAAVVGIPHPELGDMGVAFVVPAPGKTPYEAEILAFARENLASFKVPQHVLFVDGFPLTSGTDKVQKFKLREIAAQTYGVTLRRAGAKR